VAESGPAAACRCRRFCCCDGSTSCISMGEFARTATAPAGGGGGGGRATCSEERLKGAGGRAESAEGKGPVEGGRVNVGAVEG
jgi:hypothetical protein